MKKQIYKTNTGQRKYILIIIVDFCRLLFFEFHILFISCQETEVLFEVEFHPEHMSHIVVPFCLP